MGLYSLFAHTDNLESDITKLGIRVVLVSSIALFILVLIAGLVKDRSKQLRLPLFLLITFTIVVSTATLFGSTVYLNVNSESGGPVHWHADIEFWACGKQLELRDPSGLLSNKVGTPTLHEHNDQRIHLEGVVVDKATDASLGNFMTVTGGSISSEMMSLPLADRILEDQIDGDSISTTNIDGLISTDALGKKSFVATSGEKCGERVAEPQVFVYQFNKDDGTYSQIKLSDPDEYVIRSESSVPPGDCIIMEFDVEKARTNKLCGQYGIRDSRLCAKFGVEGKALEECRLREVNVEGRE